MPEIEIVLLGTGTSAGVPMIGCHCAVCESSDPHDKRSRPSALVSYDGLKILIDTSPELRLQCIANHIDMIDAVVMTHAHADHVMGLDDVRRFNAISKKPLDVWANEETHAALGRCFGYAFLPPGQGPNVFRPTLVKRVIDGPFKIGARTWTPIPLIHGDVNVLGLRIGRLAYCTDVSRIPDASWDLLRDLDVLILDALQPKPHPAHFSLDEAVEAAKKIGARETLFTHITHYLPHAETNAKLPNGMRLGFDGEHVREDLIVMSKRYQAFSDFYDAEYEHLANLQKDIPFFLRQLPKNKRLRVLDVCCGSGRSCIPIAQAGHRTVGIDIDREMLALAKRKRDAVGISAKQLELIHQDALKLKSPGKSGGKFDWATIFFNTFLNFTTLDQQDRVLQGMRNLLKPGGKIWLDLFQPDLDRLARDERGIDASLFFVPAIDKTVQRTIDIRRDRSEQTMHITFNYTWFDSHGTAKKRRRDFDMTYIFPRELQLLLERNGFIVEKIFGDYDGAPLAADSSRMIAMARRR